MLDTLFGAEMPPAVRFLLAFLIVLGLIGVTAWAVRRFGAGRLGANARGRQPRLAVIDYASVDGRRRLILVRRDNVEHLLMIGGPTDVVVEPNIVRATATPRDVPGARPTAGIDALPRAIPLPESGNGHGAGYWPLAPESNGGSRPSPRLDSQRFEPLPDELPPPRPQRDPLAALADELTPRPTASRRSAAESRAELRRPTTAAAPPPAATAEAAASADQNLADMAHRLEAALRTPATPRRTAPAAEQTQPPANAGLPPAAPRTPRPSEAKPERSEPNQGKTALYDNLEQEMASLLGRSNKT